MASRVTEQQAKEFAGLMHALLRELTAGSNDPAASLPLAQMRVCKTLATGPKAVSSISRELSVSPSAVTQIADRLERAGFLRRVAMNGDRRVRLLQLTDRCQRIMQRHEVERIHRMGAAISELSSRDRKQVAVGLKLLGEAAARARIKKTANSAGPRFLKKK